MISPFALTYPDPSLVHIKNESTGEEAWIPPDSSIPEGWNPVYSITANYTLNKPNKAAFCWLCFLIMIAGVWYLARGK